MQVSQYQPTQWDVIVDALAEGWERAEEAEKEIFCQERRNEESSDVSIWQRCAHGVVQSIYKENVVETLQQESKAKLFALLLAVEKSAQYWRNEHKKTFDVTWFNAFPKEYLALRDKLRRGAIERTFAPKLSFTARVISWVGDQTLGRMASGIWGKVRMRVLGADLLATRAQEQQDLRIPTPAEPAVLPPFDPSRFSAEIELAPHLVNLGAVYFPHLIQSGIMPKRVFLQPAVASKIHHLDLSETNDGHFDAAMVKGCVNARWMRINQSRAERFEVPANCTHFQFDECFLLESIVFGNRTTQVFFFNIWNREKEQIDTSTSLNNSTTVSRHDPINPSTTTTLEFSGERSRSPSIIS